MVQRSTLAIPTLKGSFCPFLSTCPVFVPTAVSLSHEVYNYLPDLLTVLLPDSMRSALWSEYGCVPRVWLTVGPWHISAAWRGGGVPAVLWATSWGGSEDEFRSQAQVGQGLTVPVSLPPGFWVVYTSIVSLEDKEARTMAQDAGRGSAVLGGHWGNAGAKESKLWIKFANTLHVIFNVTDSWWDISSLPSGPSFLALVLGHSICHTRCWQPLAESGSSAPKNLGLRKEVTLRFQKHRSP